MSDDELTDALREAEATLARTYGSMLSLVREAKERKLASRSGFRTTATLLATKLRLTKYEARTRVALATAGVDGIQRYLVEEAPETRTALREQLHALEQAQST